MGTKGRGGDSDGGGPRRSEDEISAFAREKLASYKVPRDIRFVSSFPRTSSGKIIRRDLGKIFNE